MEQTLLKTYSLSLLGAFLFFTSASIIAAPTGYQPVLSPSTFGNSVSFKAAFLKAYTAPTDALQKIYPSVANGVSAAGRLTASAASSIYAGSAAALTKISIPFKSGVTNVVNAAAHIPLRQLANSAVKVGSGLAKGATAVGLVGAAIELAAPSIYDWFQASGVSFNNDGLVQTDLEPTSVYSAYSWRTTVLPYQLFNTEAQACINEWARQSPNWQSGYVYSHTEYYSVTITACYLTRVSTGVKQFLSYVFRQTNPAPCPVHYIIQGSTCLIDPNYENNPVPSTNELAADRLIAHLPAAPAAVLDDAQDHGELPVADPPILTGPASSPSITTTAVRPDGRVEERVIGLTHDYAGDTVTSKERTISTVDGVSTTYDNPPAYGEGVTPAIPSQIDLSPVVDAINKFSDRNHGDLTKPTDTTLNLPEPINEDELYKSFFQNTTNPFSFDVNDYFPELPTSSGCSYEVHTSFMGRSVDFAPCEKLAPLRQVLSYIFSILTAFLIFRIIFRTDSVTA